MPPHLGAHPPSHPQLHSLGFKEIPPNSRALLCFHPHGILTIGWALTSTNPVLGHAKIKWLATEALLRLPFISDFLSWNGACAAAPFHPYLIHSRLYLTD
jgi:hypothetical protein